MEISDLEYFHLTVRGREFTFSAVVKGYKSIKKAIPEKIMYQVAKAYLSHPNYILLVLDKDPIDSLITLLQNYSQDIGNPNLIIMATPIILCKFLIWSIYCKEIKESRFRLR